MVGLDSLKISQLRGGNRLLLDLLPGDSKHPEIQTAFHHTKDFSLSLNCYVKLLQGQYFD